MLRGGELHPAGRSAATACALALRAALPLWASPIEPPPLPARRNLTCFSDPPFVVASSSLGIATPHFLRRPLAAARWLDAAGGPRGFCAPSRVSLRFPTRVAVSLTRCKHLAHTCPLQRMASGTRAVRAHARSQRSHQKAQLMAQVARRTRSGLASATPPPQIVSSPYSEWCSLYGLDRMYNMLELAALAEAHALASDESSR